MTLIHRGRITGRWRDPRLDALGYLSVAAEQLRAEHLAGALIPGEADMNAVTAGIVGLWSSA